ncbi:MAG: hypothetical protein HGA39_09525 [Coriobacteriia bacterium]|nr:hypothetical protein [Coriobacteriia bacterium]
MLGEVLVFIAPLCGLAAASLWGLGIFCVVLSYTTLTFAWASTLVRVDNKAAFICIAVSFLLSAVLSLGTFSRTQPIRTIYVLFSLVSLAGSALLWYHSPPKDAYKPSFSFGLLRKLPLGLLGVLALFVLGGRLIQGLVIQGNFTLAERVETTVIILGVVLFSILLLRRKAGHAPRIQPSWILLVILFLLAAFSVVLLDALDSRLLRMGLGIVVAGVDCFEIVIWIVLCNEVHKNQLSSVLVFGPSLVAVKVVPTLLNRYFIPGLARSLEPSATEYLSVFITATVVILVSAVLLFLSSPASRKRHVNFGEDPQSRRDMCMTIAKRAGLTGRETEIMFLISQGHSFKRMANMLFLVPGTVRGHSQSIYRKLGINTKQELIDLVDERQTEASYGSRSTIQYTRNERRLVPDTHN